MTVSIADLDAAQQQARADLEASQQAMEAYRKAAVAVEADILRQAGDQQQ